MPEENGKSAITLPIAKSKPRISFTPREMATLGILSAIGIVLGMWIMIPLIPSAPFLKYDPADVPIFLGALIFGPIAGVMMTVIVSLTHSLFEGVSGISGFVMHVAATGIASLVIGVINGAMGGTGEIGLPRGGKINIREWYKSSKGSLIAIGCGALAMTLLMIPLNLIVTPFFMGVPVSAVVNLLLPAIIPFNILKAGINGALALALYHVLYGSKILFPTGRR